MQNIVGQPVIKNNFFGRELEINSIINHLEKGNSIYLLGDRRIGKTSLLYKIIDEYSDKFNFTYFNLISPDIELLSLGHILSKIFPNFTTIENESADLESSQFIELVNRLKNNSKPTVLIFDEFPFYIENYSMEGKNKVEILLSVHRLIRQTANSNIHFIYSGESNLNRYPLLQQYFNDLFLITLNPLSKLNSMILINDLSETLKLDFSNDIKQKICDFAQGLPFNIQLLFSLISSYLSRNTKITESQFESIIEEAIKEKQFKYFQPPQNDSYKVNVLIEEIIDLTNK